MAGLKLSTVWLQWNFPSFFLPFADSKIQWKIYLTIYREHFFFTRFPTCLSFFMNFFLKCPFLHLCGKLLICQLKLHLLNQTFSQPLSKVISIFFPAGVLLIYLSDQWFVCMCYLPSHTFWMIYNKGPHTGLTHMYLAHKCSVNVNWVNE